MPWNFDAFGFVHRTSIKIEVQVYFFVEILMYKVNTHVSNSYTTEKNILGFLYDY